MDLRTTDSIQVSDGWRGGEAHLGKEFVIVREYVLDQLERNIVEALGL